MKTTYYNITYILLLLPCIILGSTTNKMEGRFTEEKSLNKEVSVNHDAILKINNEYGNLDITAWDEDTVKIEVHIKVNGNDEERVQEKLKSVDVLFETSPEMVNAKTIFDDSLKSWWGKLSDVWNKGNLKVEINYEIKIPVTNSVHLTNDYGSITLDKIEGDTKINCDYGQLIIGQLLGDENIIKINYTNNSSIKYMKTGKIYADYSNFIVEKADEIELKADYTHSKIEYANQLNYNCDYGALQTGNIGAFIGDGNYLDIDANVINKMLVINSDYGSIDVKALKSTTKEVAVKTDYTGVRIGYDADFNFDFKIKTSYGSIKVDSDDLIIMKKNQEHTSKFYQGYRGEQNTGNSINISTSYGGVKLNKN